MKQQSLRNCWLEGKGAINAWCSIPSAVTAEMMSMNDFDSITIDMQHGLVDYQMALNMLQVISGSGKTPMVRVPWNEPGIIMKSLDAGALGIICPMINTPQDATNFVGATKYAPVGHRSSGPTRAMMVHGPEYHNESNDNIISLAMIETVEALDNVEKIAATEGLTGIYIGPSDLSISMGYKPGLDRSEPEMVEAIKRIETACINNNIKVGIHCLSPSYLKDKLSNGFNLATLASDVRIYSAGIAENLKEAKS
ncbi:aldolase/citrate lyase family protein [Alphaproteobacteria bacterium]|jgi:4-hydroxy-2-oxoheptanedioate aldolase|nr:aldolase/citrate lyase family protein [Alphaproteobacteria bacterium]|tara:strand:- start:1568 stop:2326 length:759 start_codon:yes stop_codon:yes gene_type:complete